MPLRALPFKLTILLFSTLFLQLSAAQSSTTTCTAPATWVAPSAVSTVQALRDIAYCNQGDGTYNIEPGAVGADPSDSQQQNDAGASGDGNSFVNISTADQIAIIVVAVVVGVFGSKHHFTQPQIQPY